MLGTPPSQAQKPGSPGGKIKKDNIKLNGACLQEEGRSPVVICDLNNSMEGIRRPAENRHE